MVQDWRRILLPSMAFSLAFTGLSAGLAAEQRTASLQVSVVVTRSCQLWSEDAEVSVECGGSGTPVVQVTIGEQAPATATVGSPRPGPGDLQGVTVPRAAGQTVTINF